MGTMTPSEDPRMIVFNNILTHSLAPFEMKILSRVATLTPE